MEDPNRPSTTELVDPRGLDGLKDHGIKNAPGPKLPVIFCIHIYIYNIISHSEAQTFWGRTVVGAFFLFLKFLIYCILFAFPAFFEGFL